MNHLRPTSLSKDKSGFTLIELAFVITILVVIIVAVANRMSTGGGDDVARNTAFKDVTYYLEDFKTKYGVYPSASSTARGYPKSGCSVTGYKSLLDCFVANGKFQKDDETYNKLAYDPKEGAMNDANEKYVYKYCVNTNGNKYKLAALVEKQDNDKVYPNGIDGKAAEQGKRYLLVVSPATKLDEISSCAE